MYFDLTEEQKMLQESVDSYLADHNDDQQLAAYAASAELDDSTLWRGQRELGLSAILVPEEYGGMAMDLLTLAVAMESLGYNGAPGPLLGHSLVVLALVTGGSDEQKARWLPQLAAGEITGAAAFCEGENSVWLPDQWQLQGPALSGTKRHLIGSAKPGLILVGLAGGALALVDGAADGMTLTREDTFDLTRPMVSATFENLQAEPLAQGDAGRVRDAALVLLAADAFGAARHCLDKAVEYAQQREQFGRLIGSFQGLKFQLADTAALLEPCRSLYWYAAHAWDAVPADSERAAAMAKAHITEVAVKAGRAAVEAHGGIGYTWEYPLHFWLKRAMADRNLMGTPQLHRERMAALAGW